MRISMRAVRVECAAPSIIHDPRAVAAMSCISWDYRGTLGIERGNLRAMFECITSDGDCPQAGTSISGVTIVEILEEWQTDYLTHHLVTVEFSRDFIGRFFEKGDLTILAGSNLTRNGLVIQVAGRQSSMVSFLRSIREEIPIERVTKATNSEGIAQNGPTLQQFRIVKLAYKSGWYEAPKKISIRGLASKLGLSKSTVAEQLIKAENEIVGDFLGKSN
jgi:hypothetical protein|tara:strand:- start:195 stop:851 length:657 start_codon:yes stop_codon:yes gene_type:complete